VILFTKEIHLREIYNRKFSVDAEFSPFFRAQVSCCVTTSSFHFLESEDFNLISGCGSECLLIDMASMNHLCH
jgi:hypothetical protein